MYESEPATPGRWLVSGCAGVGRCQVLCSVGLLVVGLFLWGCTGSSVETEDTQPTLRHIVPAEVARLPDYASLDPRDDPRQVGSQELNDGPESQELGVSKLLREIGVLELLGSYIINVPPSAEFIAGWEANKASVSTYHYEYLADAEVMSDFESSVLRFVEYAMESPPDVSQVLHDAFFEVLEACGRASAWPEVELFEMHDGRGYDIMSHLIEPTFGLTYFEYQQLRHQCARYAATYPTLDPAVRDELLVPLRAHYAKVILERLDTELPLVEVPARYQAEVDALRRNGW